MIYYHDYINTWFIPQAELSKLRRTYEDYLKVNPIFIQVEHETRHGSCSEPSPEEYQILHDAAWYIIKAISRPHAFSNLEGPYTTADLYRIAKERNLKKLALVKR